ncbi:MAG: ABC transporter permease [Proteobacteria bacterium]|nr:ABC transporter permease [Pseudomonadota bacterium]MDE3208090.1 ABC transporter permease [Pseudomonadota bacterium]
MKPELIRPDAGRVVLSGSWRLNQLKTNYRFLRHELCCQKESEVTWDLMNLEGLDSAGALLIWQCWGRRWPSGLAIKDGDRGLLECVSGIARPVVPAVRRDWLSPVVAIGLGVGTCFAQFREFVVLFGQLVRTFLWTLIHPAWFPAREFSATLYKACVTALPITALVGALIGIVLSYLSAQQLETYGANIYIVNLLGMGIMREMGPLLAAILVAGRSGSAITAELGAMRMNQELDALAAMGLSIPLRLLLPKVLGLALALPLLVVWTNIMALAGGMWIAYEKLGIGFTYFLQRLPTVVPLVNLWLGVGKGVIFGLAIALMSTYIGLNIEPNSESLGQGTTRSVVMAITVVIVLDALFAVMFSGVGL